MNPDIPLFDGTRPYQQIPFQFSLHIQEYPGTPSRHVEFLETRARDPRPALIEALRAIGPEGSVLAYNMSFENRILGELAEAFPTEATFLRGLITRMRDLLQPFRDFSLYHPAQKGSCSIKQVLPAFTSMSYDALDIHQGDQAAREYLQVVYGDSGDKPEGDPTAIPWGTLTGTTGGSSDLARRDKIFNDLRRYCAQDTLAMVELLGVIEGYVR